MNEMKFLKIKFLLINIFNILGKWSCIACECRDLKYTLILCMNSVSGLHLTNLRYVINVACFDCIILCFKLRGMTYRYDVYGNCDCAIVA